MSLGFTSSYRKEVAWDGLLTESRSRKMLLLPQNRTIGITNVLCNVIQHLALCERTSGRKKSSERDVVDNV